jgi:hypothetical protein
MVNYEEIGVSISKYQHLPGKTKGIKKSKATKDNKLRLQ